MQVSLLPTSPALLDIAYAAARQCYSPQNAGEMSFPVDREKAAELIRKVMESGHLSVLEHINLTFAISGVSRVLTHQLVRHRHASYSQQSQRYVRVARAYTVPPSILWKPEALTAYVDIMEAAQATYDQLTTELGISQEDARYIIPHCVHSAIVVTMNARELYSVFFPLRCCARAQWEIRDLARAMLVLCKKELPDVFDQAGASCKILGYCPEGQDKTCGAVPCR